MKLSEHNTKVPLLMNLTPAPSHNKLVTLEEDLLGDFILKAMVTVVPEKGEANRALIILLSKSLKRPELAFMIVRGELSPSKFFEIQCGANRLVQKFHKLKLG